MTRAPAFDIFLGIMVTEKRVAVVDDDVQMGILVRDMLSGEGYSVSCFTSVAEALVAFKKSVPHIVITDLNMRDINGMALLQKVRTDFPQTVCIMMTAFGSIETAIEAMKNGAYHYVVKPFKMDEFTMVVQRAWERSELARENKALRSELRREFSIDSIIGKSAPMRDLFDVVRRVAPAVANVLISGESGVGKEVVARAIHKLGTRAKKPFIPINCTAIPEALLESELFGHVRGAFTGAANDKRGLFEEANGGTLFLDEIGDMSLGLQAKILRVLQDREIRAVGGTQSKPIDVRIVSATHRDLKAYVRDGKFREDLFYRLNVIPVMVPALRDRTEDIPLLVEHFVHKYALQNHSKVEGVTPEALARLVAHPWPGNVRELENTIERAVVLAKSKLLTEQDVMGSALEKAKEGFEQIFSDTPTLAQIEERYIKLIMARCSNRKDAAAKILGINRRTLYRKEKEYGTVPVDAPEPELEE